MQGGGQPPSHANRSIAACPRSQAAGSVYRVTGPYNTRCCAAGSFLPACCRRPGPDVVVDSVASFAIRGCDDNGRRHIGVIEESCTTANRRFHARAATKPRFGAARTNTNTGGFGEPNEPSDDVQRLSPVHGFGRDGMGFVGLADTANCAPSVRGSV